MPHHFDSLEAANLSNAWLTIGVFDGVHRGHQEILRQLTAGAHANGASAVVLTFSPHPAFVLAGREIKCLTTAEERARKLFSLGIDAVITLQFTHALAERSADEFMADIKQHLGLQQLLIGYDFALGKNRAGNYDRLVQIGRELNFGVTRIDAIQLDTQVISSTAIRQEIALGDVKMAAGGLGAPYEIHGIVVQGDGRGRTIGIPTANITTSPGKAIPANGVYLCQAEVGGNLYTAVVNIGLRPTFTDGKTIERIEAHLLDFNNDIYGKEICLAFIDRIRDEKKFSDVNALITQINADIASARSWAAKA